MNISFDWFIQQMISNPIVLISVLLTLGVIFVNGWTDAPNAIATCVATRCLTPKAAVIMSAVFNFLGVLIMSIIMPQVTATISNMVTFGNGSEAAMALCAALISIIIWAVTAWFFGIPTSESHALIAGLTGAAIAMHNGLSGVNGDEWMKVVIGLVFATILGFGLGWLFTKLTALAFRRSDRRKANRFFKGAQIFGGAAMSYMHGAQDGQKFMGVLLLCTYILKDDGGTLTVNAPVWMMALCSIVMAVGTSIGGYKIIKSVGLDMVKLERYQGFSADIAGASSLLVSSVFGIPVSTTQTKTTAIMGVGAAKRLSSINFSVVKEMLLAWALTFPGCGLIGYIVTKILLFIF